MLQNSFALIKWLGKLSERSEWNFPACVPYLSIRSRSFSSGNIIGSIPYLVPFENWAAYSIEISLCLRGSPNDNGVTLTLLFSLSASLLVFPGIFARPQASLIHTPPPESPSPYLGPAQHVYMYCSFAHVCTCVCMWALTSMSTAAAAAPFPYTCV